MKQFLIDMPTLTSFWVTAPSEAEAIKALYEATAELELRLHIGTEGTPVQKLAADVLDAAEALIVSFEPAAGRAQEGVDGFAGAAGANGAMEGESGRDGSPGSPGGPGAAGKPAGKIALVANMFQGQLRIDNSGQAGGTGGSGGLGGRGGDGAPGSPAASGIIDCRRGPGRGGNGGAGGIGGDGGAAGIGGDGGPVTIAFKGVSAGSLVDAGAAGGPQGNSGIGGRGGDGGRGAPEGPSFGFCRGAARIGQPGASGAPGKQGASSSIGRSDVISGNFGTTRIDETSYVKLAAQ